jgi:transposase
MDAYDYKITSTILDAGYYSEENLKFLYNRNVAFLTRYIPNQKIYKRILNISLNDIDDMKYHVMKDERILKIKRVNINEIAGMKIYAYICKDLTEANKLKFNTLSEFECENKDYKEIDEITKQLRKRGIFALLSSLKMPTNEILSVYYERTRLEQIFDFAINELDALPLRKHSEIAIRGHLMIVFMSTIAHVYMEKLMDKKKFN